MTLSTPPAYKIKDDRHMIKEKWETADLVYPNTSHFITYKCVRKVTFYFIWF